MKDKIKIAIDAMKFFKEKLHNGIYGEFVGNFDTAISALEKRIPKKPRADNDGWLCCPNCNETFPMFDSLHKRLNCCGCCGQRLDWSKADKQRSDTE